MASVKVPLQESRVLKHFGTEGATRQRVKSGKFPGGHWWAHREVLRDPWGSPGGRGRSLGFRDVKFEAHVDSFCLYPLFFNSFSFAFCEAFEETVEYDAFAVIQNFQLRN